MLQKEYEGVVQELADFKAALETTVERHRQQDNVLKELACVVEQQKCRLKVELNTTQVPSLQFLARLWTYLCVWKDQQVSQITVCYIITAY